jgi:hypothetical protein
MAEIATTRLALPDLEVTLDVPWYPRWAHEVLEERVDAGRLERVDLYATRHGDILHVLKTSFDSASGTRPYLISLRDGDVIEGRYLQVMNFGHSRPTIEEAFADRTVRAERAAMIRSRLDAAVMATVLR